MTPNERAALLAAIRRHEADMSGPNAHTLDPRVRASHSNIALALALALTADSLADVADAIRSQSE